MATPGGLGSCWLIAKPYCTRDAQAGGHLRPHRKAGHGRAGESRELHGRLRLLPERPVSPFRLDDPQGEPPERPASRQPGRSGFLSLAGGRFPLNDKGPGFRRGLLTRYYRGTEMTGLLTLAAFKILPLIKTQAAELFIRSPLWHYRAGAYPPSDKPAP